MLTDRFIVTKQRLRPCSLPLQIIAQIAIWTMIIPIVVMQISTWIYQQIYFSIYGIPKAKFWDYVIIDRHKLKKLNGVQKIACAYCGYTNGAVAWCKVIANRTEVYSCAIKHSVAKKGQEHQKEFFEYEDFR